MRHSIGNLLGTLGMMSAIPALGAVSVTRQGNQTIYDISVEGVATAPVNLGGKNFVSARLKGVDQFAAIHYDLGKPEVPVLRMVVDGDVVVEDQSIQVNGLLDVGQPIKPSQPSWDKSMKFSPPVTFDAAVYSQNSFTVAPAYEIAKAGSYRGVPRNMVTLNAMRYNPVTGAYQLRSHYKVTVTAKPLLGDGAQPTMAFVVGAKFKDSPSLATMIQLKESEGFLTRKLVVGESGLNKDTDIRNALKAMLKGGENLRFAVLVGDDEDVPSHESDHINGVTDHYYRSIDTDNYESDINGPDIGLGRISVRTESQLTAVVGKISRYTDGRFASDQWMTHPAFVTTHDRYQVAEGTHNAVIAKHFAPRGYNRVFPDASEKGGDKLFPVSLHATPSQIVQHMKQGRFIINYSGHGSHTGWEDVTAANVLSLDDPNALPWVISNACITGDFREEPVFGETWLRHPNGAIVFFGSMDSSYWDEDDIMERGMYDAVFVNNTRSFDLIHQAALGEVWRHYGGGGKSAYYWETYVTFGDPSLDLRLGASVDATVEGPDSIIVGEQEATWTITSPNGPANDARIALSRASDGKSITGVTNASGEVTLSLAAFQGAVEPLRMVVYGSDFRQVTKDLAVVAPNQAYLGFTGWTINGRSASGAHVGEVASVGATVENFGLIATNGGRVWIKTITGPATVKSAEVKAPALASREKKTIGNGLSFTVNTDARLGESVKVEFGWETSEGQTGVSTANWPIMRGDIEVAVIDYGTGTTEGIGSDGEVFVTLKNIGNESIRSGELSGKAGSCTSRVDGVVAVPEITPGATVRVPASFHVVTDGQCVSGSTGHFDLTGTYQGASRAVTIGGQVSYMVGVLEVEIERFVGMALPIPDGRDSVEKAIQMSGSGAIKDISVKIDIKHTYVGDLTVTLVTPTGREVVLRNREGGSQDNVTEHYGHGGTAAPDLDALAGSETRGEWKIRVQDGVSSDTGTLESLELEIRHW